MMGANASPNFSGATGGQVQQQPYQQYVYQLYQQQPSQNVGAFHA
jgi:hypothetical protein